MSGLWSRIGTAFERTDIGAAGDGLRGMEEPVRSTNTRYAPIRNAVERRVNSFLRDDLVSHLEIGPNELFVLHYIEIAPDKQGEAELEQFMHEFSPESRVYWVKKLLGGAVGQHVSVDQFLGLDREFKAEQLAETDPYEEALNQSVIPPYRVILHGRWEARKEKPVAIPATSNPANDAAESSATHPQELRASGPQLRLSVQDAKEPDPGNWAGTRVVEIDSYPAVLGTSAEADAEISGYYVSARHCTLHWESRQLWLVDHSTNGTWVDGEKLRHGARVALANGAVISFGRDRGETDYDRYPVIRLTSASPAFAPAAPGGPAPAAAAKKPPLAVISIVDASGSPRRDVLTVPYTIGRGSAQDYVVPDANQGVSREHLVIEAVDATGALTLNRAVSKNGTSSSSGALPERFTWRFGQEIVLGEKWSSSPPVRLTLQPVEDKT
jgi:pSer/pThr/pTyr-binding forkhead associated (FHA) protein